MMIAIAREETGDSPVVMILALARIAFPCPRPRDDIGTLARLSNARGGRCALYVATRALITP